MGWNRINPDSMGIEVKSGRGSSASIITKRLDEYRYDVSNNRYNTWYFVYNAGLGSGNNDTDILEVHKPPLYAFALNKQTVRNYVLSRFQMATNNWISVSDNIFTSPTETRIGAAYYTNPFLSSNLNYSIRNANYSNGLLYDWLESSSNDARILRWTAVPEDVVYTCNIYSHSGIIGSAEYYPNDFVEIHRVDYFNANRTGYRTTAWRANNVNYNIPVGGQTGLISIPTGDVTYGVTEVRAQYTVITYTITYSEVYGLTNNNPTSYNINVDTITLSNPTGTRTGYTFKNWYTSRTGGTRVITINKGSYGDKTIYAQWNTVPYSISYNLNGGSGSHGNPTSYNIESNTITLGFGTVNKIGYNISGWNDSSNNRVSSIPKGSTGNKSFTLVYSPINYSITYTNVITSHSNPTSYTIESNNINLTNPTNRTGYIFEGWYSGNAKVTTISKGSYGNKTIEARWTPITYTITYVDTKGSTNNNPTSYTIEDEVIFTNLPSVLGYNFGEWNISKINKGSTGNKTITALWNIITYNIYYDQTISGSSGSPSPNPTTFNIESPNILIVKGGITKPHYNFLGWYTSTTVDESKRVIEIDPKSNTHNITLYDHWIIIQYNLSFDLNGGIGSHGNPSQYTYETETFNLTSGSINKIGYTFDGWEDTAGNIITSIPKGSSGNKAFKARWKAIVYNIEYQYNDDTLDPSTRPNNPSTYTIETNTITLLNPTRQGYTFLRWTNESGNNITTILKGSVGNRVIYANWNKNDYLVEFYNEGNLIFSYNSSYRSQIVYSGPIPVKNSSIGFVHTFIGWNDDPDATITKPLPITEAKTQKFYALYSTKTKGIRYRNQIVDVKLGTKNVTEIYMGDKKIWER